MASSTVTAAGQALHLTPSAVSQQVRSLARDLDLELLQPAGRGVRLTTAAEILLDHADRLHAKWERARADLDAHRLGDRGPLRLCAFPSALASLLPATIEQLHLDPPLHQSRERCTNRGMKPARRHACASICAAPHLPATGST